MSDLAQRPRPRPVGSSHWAAVEFCREWMVYLGEEDTVVAQGATGAICELYSSRYVALVENRTGNIEVPLVQRAVVLATSDGRRAVVFHSGGCFGDAAELADAYGIALITYMARAGDIAAANRVAVPICRSYRLP
ncbi:hypothetical protein ACO2Q7_08380 [Rathayibacter sp. KR2-224]|uniref:hypothetical protein n=1 Tax=Rathayibacter sp. KR2-224 TaxID=3400913 RepID=UPI003C0A8697